MTDLEELERLHAGLPVLRAETWNHEDGEGHAAIIAVLDSEDDCDDEHPDAYDAAVAGVKCLNALPGLIAELRALREVAEAAREHEEMDQPGMTTLRDHARDALRAALAKVPK